MHALKRRQERAHRPQHDVSRVGRYGTAAEKKSIHYSQGKTDRVKALHEQFALRLSTEQAKRSRFVDESGVNLGMTKLYGRAQPGQPVVKSTSGYSGAHYAVAPW